MYKYEYVTVDAKNKMFSTVFENHKAIIDQYAQNGWRFISVIPISTFGSGRINKIDLVFEKEAD